MLVGQPPRRQSFTIKKRGDGMNGCQPMVGTVNDASTPTTARS
jgi:hypothetical protein